MPIETCEYHTEFAANVAVIKNDIKYIREKVCQHIEEGEKQGGFRDRLVVAEQALKGYKQEISAIKKGYWVSGVIGGIIGSLFTHTAPEIIMNIVKLFLAK